MAHMEEESRILYDLVGALEDENWRFRERVEQLEDENSKLRSLLDGDKKALELVEENAELKKSLKMKKKDKKAPSSLMSISRDRSGSKTKEPLSPQISVGSLGERNAVGGSSNGRVRERTYSRGSKDPSPTTIVAEKANSATFGSLAPVGSPNNTRDRTDGIKESKDDWNFGEKMLNFFPFSRSPAASPPRTEPQFSQKIHADAANHLFRTDTLEQLGEFLRDRPELMDTLKKSEKQQRLNVLQEPYSIHPFPFSNQNAPSLCGSPPSNLTSISATSLGKTFRLVTPFEDKQEFLIELNNGKRVSCKSISTYPFRADGRRLGDPICDAFNLIFRGKHGIISLADGCNWGSKSKEAAHRACSAFVEYVSNKAHLMNNTSQAYHILLGGFAKAHLNIMDGKVDRWDAGTCTLLGGMLIPIKTESFTPSSTIPGHINSPPGGSPTGNPPSAPGFFSPSPPTNNLHQVSSNVSSNSPPPTNPSVSNNTVNICVDHSETPKQKWICVLANVGDCKAFAYSQKYRKVVDISFQASIRNSEDPGGRLGPTLPPTGLADLRNLDFFYHICDEGDFILFVSDGVHDNLDPSHLGLAPNDLDHAATKWEELSILDAAQLKSKHATQRLLELIETDGTSAITSSGIVDRVMKYCEQVTAKSRIWMQENPKKQLPKDYKSFPGKMDHTTICAVMVSDYYQDD